MRVARHVVERSRQLLVPVPPLVRDHLGLVGTTEVWWHIVKKGEAALTVTGYRARGRQLRNAECPSCAAYRVKVEELQKRLRSAPERAMRQFRMQEWLTRFRLELRGLPVLEAINDRLRRLEDQLGVRRGPWAYRAKRGRGRAVETFHLPEPPATPPAGSPSPARAGAEAPSENVPAPAVEK